MKEKHINEEISQNNFFGLCTQELKVMIGNSKIEQDRLRSIKKIEQLRQKTQQRDNKSADQLMDNIVIDYLKTYQLNYTYSVFMRQRDLISNQITNKLYLLQLMNLQNIYNSTSRLDISIIEMMLIQQQNQMSKSKQTNQMGSQVNLIGKNSVVNHQLINQLRISQARKQVQTNQKKHYQRLLSTMKQSLTLTLKDELKKQFDLKIKNIKNEYQQQVKVLKQKNKQFLMNNPKLNPKIQQYLTKIQKLQANNADLSDKIKALQRQKITHNCSKNQQILQKEQQLNQQRKQLQSKKNQYQLALRCIQTSIQQLTLKKQHLNQQSKPIDVFINDIKKNKASKDHMIQQIYGRLFIMDKRVETLSNDNQSLIEQNRQLLCKIKQLQTIKQQLSQKYKQTSKKQEQLKKQTLKVKTKEVMVGVNYQQIKQSKYEYEKKQHAIDEMQLQQQSEQQQRMIDIKNKYRLEIGSIYSEMRTLRNKLRLSVQNFQ